MCPGFIIGSKPVPDFGYFSVCFVETSMKERHLSSIFIIVCGVILLCNMVSLFIDRDFINLKKDCIFLCRSTPFSLLKNILNALCVGIIINYIPCALIETNCILFRSH